MDCCTGLVMVFGLFGGYVFGPGTAAEISEWGVDRLEPFHGDRQIDTVSLQWRAREKNFFDRRLSLRLGATLSRATGQITQLGNDGAYALNSPGWGAGPAVDGRLTLLSHGNVRVSMDASAAVLLYDRRFPAGGDRYNGMLQAGPSLGFTTGSGRVDIGWRWMHVSNGQGLTPRNPSYEGRGMTLRWQMPL